MKLKAGYMTQPQSEGGVSIVMTVYCSFSIKVWACLTVLSHFLYVWESPSILRLFKVQTAREIYHTS